MKKKKTCLHIFNKKTLLYAGLGSKNWEWEKWKKKHVRLFNKKTPLHAKLGSKQWNF